MGRWEGKGENEYRDAKPGKSNSKHLRGYFWDWVRDIRFDREEVAEIIDGGAFRSDEGVWGKTKRAGEFGYFVEWWVDLGHRWLLIGRVLYLMICRAWEVRFSKWLMAQSMSFA